ncbi:MAG: hypothetical protein ABIP64_18450 [Burkholderiales bacterium]
MNFLAKTTFATIVTTFAISAAYAGDRDPGVNKRQSSQHHRIVEGVKPAS